MPGTTNRRPEPLLIRTGAVAFAAAALLGAFETVIPGGPGFPLAGIVGVTLVPLILLIGPRVPRSALVALGPLGVALIAATVANADGVSDAAIFYAWPVLWVAYFFGPWATASLVTSIGIAHGVVLALATSGGSFDRWLDVVVSTALIGLVVQALAVRNRRLVAQLRDEARIDPLTGLLNRRGFEERLEAELARGRRDDRELAVVAVDVDRFKAINDQFGHDVGDRVLTWIAQTIGRQTRASDLTARMGGDEFLIVLPATDVGAATEFADRLRAAVAAGSRRFPQGLDVSISAGVAADAGAADRALYEAKARGRNSVAVAPRLDLSPHN